MQQNINIYIKLIIHYWKKNNNSWLTTVVCIRTVIRGVWIMIPYAFFGLFWFMFMFGMSTATISLMIFWWTMMARVWLFRTSATSISVTRWISSKHELNIKYCSRKINQIIFKHPTKINKSF